MSHGVLSPEQQAAIRPFVEEKVVHDLGAGDLTLSKWLIEAGAKQVVAIDRNDAEGGFDSLGRLIRWVCRFHEYEDPIDVAFMSWPVNWTVSLDTLANRARIVIYLGSNLDGSACGDPSLWTALSQREVLVHLPHPKNTLIVYGPGAANREPLPEEFAALNQERIYSYHEFFDTTASV